MRKHKLCFELLKIVNSGLGFIEFMADATSLMPPNGIMNQYN